jgi:Peptidase family C25
MNDKILITNNSALQQKYGSGVAKIQAAVQRLINSDKARGLNTRIIAVDDSQDMQAVKGKPVTDATDPRQNKQAVDAIYKAIVPDYLVLLGSIDIVPHQDLRNPLYDPNRPDVDVDEFSFGDLPYACEAPYSQQPKDFIGPTRVLGRIPDVTNGSDPSYLIGLLDVAAGWTARTAQDYLEYLGISAEVWQQSTSTSLQNTFGSDTDLQVSPPKGPNWGKPLLSRLSHFINCHGAPSTPVFYGQPVGQEVYPEAHKATWIDKRISQGTIVAAECCYGAELYDPAAVADQQIGICNTYLANGAYGFWGSTTIAYGPSEGNGSADLIAQFFVQRVIAGASLGRAALEARQQFAQSSATLSPEDEKTLSQYILLGDPSIQPVPIPAPHPVLEMKGKIKGVASASEMIAESRAARRRRLLVRGIQIAASQAFATRRTKRKLTGTLDAAMRKFAREANISEPAILSFDIQRPRITTRKALLAVAEKIPMPSTVHIAMGRTHRHKAVVRISLIVAQEQNGQIVRLRRLHSR